MKAKIITIEKERIVESGEEQLAVVFDIASDEGDVLMTARIGAPLDTDSDAIKDMVRAYVETYEKDHAAKERNAENDAANEKADATIKALTGLEI